MVKDDPMQKYRKTSTTEYIIDLQEKIDRMLKFANENSQKVQIKMKNQYDKWFTVQKLQPGDEALVLIPTNNNKLLSR